jgi:AraC-like DNA-binding protein
MESSDITLTQVIKVASCAKAADLNSWRSVMQKAVPGIDVTSPLKCLSGELTLFDFAGARFWLFQSNVQCLSRSEPCAGGRFSPMAICVLEGCTSLSQQGRQCDLAPGEFAYIDSAMPHVIECKTSFRHLYLQFPSTTFTREAFHIAVSRTQRADHAMNRTFFDCAHNLWRTAPSLHPLKYAPALASLVSLATLTSAFECGSNVALPFRVRRAMALIENNLGEEWLTPQMVAQAQRVSRRYLDELFGISGYSVDGWIWERRLMRSAEELAIDGSSRGPIRKSILQVLLDLGFKSPSHFSRVFSDRFGLSPSEYRKKIAMRHPAQSRPEASSTIGRRGHFERMEQAEAGRRRAA